MSRRLRPPLMAWPIAMMALAGCGRAGLPDAVTEQGQQTTDLWRIFLWVALVIGVIVYALVIFVVIRYHRRRGQDRPPSQRQTVISLEVLYTAVPLAIVAVLLGLSLRTERDVTHLAADPDLTVEVTAFQWQWEFTYPEQGVTLSGLPGQGPELVLPIDRTVRFELESRDVVHSFWVPRFLRKLDLIPGERNEMDVRLTETGEWSGVCSEFCGLDHWEMSFTVRAVTPDDFEAWIEENRSP